jgi:hypothetical protein
MASGQYGVAGGCGIRVPLDTATAREGVTPTRAMRWYLSEIPGSWIRGLPQTRDPRDLHRGPKVWGMGSGVTPVHGTWSTAYAYAVPTACWYTHSAAAPQLVEMWSGGDPGSWDPGIVMSGIMTRETSRWMRSLVVRSCGRDTAEHRDAVQHHAHTRPRRSTAYA